MWDDDNNVPDSDPMGLFLKNYGIRGDYTPDIVLTFADPCPDLQYFKVDDVVQGSAITYSETVTQYRPGQDPSTMFDGNEGTGCLNKTRADSARIFFTGMQLHLNLSIAQFDAVVFTDTDVNTTYKVETTEETKVLTYSTNDGRTGKWLDFGPMSGTLVGVSLDNLASAVGTNVYITGIEVNGTVLIDSSTEPAKVVAPPDVANRKLTVDGGLWGTSDVIYSQPPIFNSNGF